MALGPVLRSARFSEGGRPRSVAGAISRCFSSGSRSGSHTALRTTICRSSSQTHSRSWSCASPSAWSFGIDRATAQRCAVARIEPGANGGRTFDAGGDRERPRTSVTLKAPTPVRTWADVHELDARWTSKTHSAAKRGNRNTVYAGELKPSDGLEPSTPSLPWRFRASATRPVKCAC
jgi:hypothetical protein